MNFKIGNKLPRFFHNSHLLNSIKSRVETFHLVKDMQDNKYIKASVCLLFVIFKQKQNKILLIYPKLVFWKILTGLLIKFKLYIPISSPNTEP